MRHFTTVRARYGETDQAGVVYHSTYLSWFEMGRTELMRDAGHSYAEFERDRNLRLTVVEAHVSYHAPSYYDEPVRIESWIRDLRRVRFHVHHRITAAGRVIATGYVGLACVAFDGRISAIPDDVRGRLEPFIEEGAGGKESPGPAVSTRHRGNPA
jgi:acyl-CoA thioester hydrolase